MSCEFRVTDHAIRRYRERVEPCTQQQAWDRLLHAAEIAHPASARQVRWFSSRGGGRQDRVQGVGAMLYCPVESLLLCGRRLPCGDVLIVTVIRCPDDSAQRIRRHAHDRKRQQTE